MIKVFNYLCENGHTTEAFVDSDTRVIQCPVCSKDALKQVSAPMFRLDGTTGDFPGEAMRWEQKRAEKLKQERKHNEA